MDDLLTPASPQVRGQQLAETPRETAQMFAVMKTVESGALPDRHWRTRSKSRERSKQSQSHRSHRLETVKSNIDAPALWHCSLRKLPIVAAPSLSTLSSPSSEEGAPITSTSPSAAQLESPALLL